jgi:hypothetical protein
MWLKEESQSGVQAGRVQTHRQGETTRRRAILTTCSLHAGEWSLLPGTRNNRQNQATRYRFRPEERESLQGNRRFGTILAPPTTRKVPRPIPRDRLPASVAWCAAAHGTRPPAAAAWPRAPRKPPRPAATTLLTAPLRSEDETTKAQVPLVQSRARLETNLLSIALAAPRIAVSSCVSRCSVAGKIFAIAPSSRNRLFSAAKSHSQIADSLDWQ